MAATQSIKKPRGSLWDRFHAKIEPVTESGCWVWTAGTRGGYGKIGLGRRHQGELSAHRVAWHLYRGDIPAGLDVLHRCDVRCCVNPDHLYLGTAKKNAEDAVRRGQQPSGIHSYNARLTDEAALHIARREMSSRKYARLYGISEAAVRKIWHGRAWSKVTNP